MISGLTSILDLALLETTLVRILPSGLPLLLGLLAKVWPVQCWLSTLKYQCPTALAFHLPALDFQTRRRERKSRSLQLVLLDLQVDRHPMVASLPGCKCLEVTFFS